MHALTPKRPGEQELALLTWLADHPAITVGEVADQYGAARGLARSTVLTMMERLRKKGHLTRRRVQGLFRYSAGAGPDAVLKEAVGSFVSRTLGGSVSPFVAYLSDDAEVTPEELAELEALVARLQTRARKP
ncbi:methicillin resistance protein [Luteitalea sp. TBR-22]|uniref:BlaI/MecI/CopY family transcriptional regulator n=1 Tax=Luteitalea sp. TBR-22 TaxID=2802971 RepID=UPI001AFCAEA8|nr:BlaI/MecI/CopY family transcriptional regulator [Luteitalea sp. TBR-22]BCS34267.1 methicillin resistance protein [Luteitalea sp. TBR-22]